MGEYAWANHVAKIKNKLSLHGECKFYWQETGETYVAVNFVGDTFIDYGRIMMGESCTGESYVRNPGLHTALKSAVMIGRSGAS